MREDSNPVRGTKDYLPIEAKVREHLRSNILKTYINYGFNQIKTPIIENINLLLNSDNGDNSKLMYKILKRGEKLDLEARDERSLVDLGLRYDLTVPLSRFYSNNKDKLLPVFKSIQIDDVFRAERPQKGRSRQFVQCDIDIINDSSINSEIEVLYVSAKAMLSLGFKNFTFKINDRRIISKIITLSGFDVELVNDISIIIDKIDKIGIEGVKEELLIKEFKKENVEMLIEKLISINKFGLKYLYSIEIDSNILNDLNIVINTINELSDGLFNAVFDINIIRGQGYYTSMVFELYMDGFSGACGGGGRYDNMIGKILNVDVPAVGFSLGFERLFMIFIENKMYADKRNNLALLYNKDDSFINLIKYQEDLIKDYNVSLIEKRKNMSFQLKNLKENGYDYFLLFNEKVIREIE